MSNESKELSKKLRTIEKELKTETIAQINAGYSQYYINLIRDKKIKQFITVKNSELGVGHQGKEKTINGNTYLWANIKMLELKEDADTSTDQQKSEDAAAQSKQTSKTPGTKTIRMRKKKELSYYDFIGFCAKDKGNLSQFTGQQNSSKLENENLLNDWFRTQLNNPDTDGDLDKKLSQSQFSLWEIENVPSNYGITLYITLGVLALVILASIFYFTPLWKKIRGFFVKKTDSKDSNEQ